MLAGNNLVTTVEDLPLESHSSVPAPAEPAALEGIRSVEVRHSGLYPMVWFGNRQNQASEQYRIIRTKILHHPAQPRVVVLTSAGAGDGKSVTAINLAGALALKYGQKVLLLEGDLRRAGIAESLGIPSEPGLAEVLSGETPLSKAVVQVETLPTLFVLPGGKAKRNPAELLDSPQWKELAAKIRTHFDYVVIDAPPLGLVADFHLLEAVSDGVILVVRPDHTDRSVCSSALAGVNREKLIGAVLNAVDDWILVKSPSYGYYRSRRFEEE